jgi:hypothetical protein
MFENIVSVATCFAPWSARPLQAPSSQVAPGVEAHAAAGSRTAVQRQADRAAVLLVLGQPPSGAADPRRAGVLLFTSRGPRTASGVTLPADTDGAGTPRTVVQAVLVNLLNPNPYLGWALVLGPNAVAAWRQSPVDAVALIVAFYAVLVAGLATFIVVTGSARFLNATAQRVLMLLSALALPPSAYQLAVVCGGQPGLLAVGGRRASTAPSARP